MKRVAVFCGSSSGVNEVYMRQASLVGQALAAHNIDVVYGGANIGLMGAVADGALASGGKVIGVLPHFLKNKEIAHNQLTELILVDTMHERKLKMNDLCDGVIALPGGFGTFEELFEMLTWAQLGLHKKPIGLLNINGFYESLSTMIQTMVVQGFLKEANHRMLLISNDVTDLLNQMNTYEAPAVGKWISPETT